MSLQGVITLVDFCIAPIIAYMYALSESESVRVHFAPGSKRRSFPLEYSPSKLHRHAAPGICMLLNAGKKLKEACAARAVPARFSCLCYPPPNTHRPINLASSKKGTAAA